MTSDSSLPGATTRRRLAAVRRPLAEIPQATWDTLATRSPWATPFSRWAFHRAWWIGYGESAHEDTFVVVDPAAPDEIVGIVPLMHRHMVEPEDASRRTALRADEGEPLTQVPPTAKMIFFGASYHADYATVLAAPDDLPDVADAIAARLIAPPGPEDPHPVPWDAVDLRRLRAADAAGDLLADALKRHGAGVNLQVTVEPEDVCPVATLTADGAPADFDAFLGTLGKKERHEIRRKVRRAETAGEVRLERSADPVADLPAFIELHQKRWGADGLFPEGPGGDASRAFFRALFELADGMGIELRFLSVGGRRIGAGVTFEDTNAVYYYNAGVDPEARELSPGVVMCAQYLAQAIASGHTRFDFLRGNEGYKYEWGAIDEPIVRVLARPGEA